MCKSGGDRPGLPAPNKPEGFSGRKATLNHSSGPEISEFRRCVKVEETVLGFPPLISLKVFVDVKQHSTTAPVQRYQSSGGV